MLSPRPTFISAEGACVSKISCSAVHQHISLWPEALQAFSADLRSMLALGHTFIVAGGACVSTIYSCSIPSTNTFHCGLHAAEALQAFSIFRYLHGLRCMLAFNTVLNPRQASWLEAHARQQYIFVFCCGLRRCRPFNILMTGLKYMLAFNAVHAEP